MKELGNELSKRRARWGFGDVFKVWFVKDGVLCVIVTLPEYEARLIGILKTWTFTRPRELLLGD